MPSAGRARQIAITLVVDSDRQGRHRNGPLAVLDLAGDPIHARTEELLGAVEEIGHVSAAVEAHQIARQQTLEQLPIPGQDPEEIDGRKRDVEKERDPQIRARPSQEEGQAHQLIVVNPDEIAVVGDFGGHHREASIHLLVGGPLVSIELEAAWKGMQERPDRAVREAEVVLTHLGHRQLDRDEPVRRRSRVVLERPRDRESARPAIRSTFRRDCEAPDPARRRARPARAAKLVAPFVVSTRIGRRLLATMRRFWAFDIVAPILRRRFRKVGDLEHEREPRWHAE